MPKIYVIGNRTRLKVGNDMPTSGTPNDGPRCEYFRGYINALAKTSNEEVSTPRDIWLGF